MDSHLLFEMTYVLYRIHSTIIHGERWLMETPGKFRLFYPPCEGRFRNLAQGLLHNISSYSLARGIPAFYFVKILFLIRERLAGWSSRPLSVYSVFFIIGRDIRAGRGPTDGANCRVTNRSPSPQELGYELNEPNTINL